MIENHNENNKHVNLHPHSTRYSEKKKPESNLPLSRDLNISEDNQNSKEFIGKSEKLNNLPPEPCNKGFASTTAKKRTWEQWSIEEMNMFFDALTIHGKNFDNIWKYMFGKMGKNMIRNREQIRHFYYRTWAKLSKYIKGAASSKDASNLKHNFLELYTLLSYGELRRKVGFSIDETRFQRLVRDNLSQLALNGSTCMKLKGKKIRIKLPSCLALKKIQSLQSEKDAPEDKKVIVPQSLVVLLWPQTNSDWVYVQSLSHNPRTKFKLHPSVRVTDVVKVLEKRWRSKDTQFLENFRREYVATSQVAANTDVTSDKGPTDLRVAINLRLAKSHLEKLAQTPPVPPPNKKPPTTQLRLDTRPVVKGMMIGPGEISPIHFDPESQTDLSKHKESHGTEGDRHRRSCFTFGQINKETSFGEMEKKVCLNDLNDGCIKTEDIQSGDSFENGIDESLTSHLTKLTFADLYTMLQCPTKINLEYKIEARNDDTGDIEDVHRDDKKIFHQLFYLALAETCQKFPTTPHVTITTHAQVPLPPPKHASTSTVGLEDLTKSSEKLISHYHPTSYHYDTALPDVAKVSLPPTIRSPTTPMLLLLPTTQTPLSIQRPNNASPFVSIKPRPPPVPVPSLPTGDGTTHRPTCDQTTTLFSDRPPPCVVVGSPKGQPPPRRYRGRLRRCALRQAGTCHIPKAIVPRTVQLLTAVPTPIPQYRHNGSFDTSRSTATTFYPGITNGSTASNLDLLTRQVKSIAKLSNPNHGQSVSGGLLVEGEDTLREQGISMFRALTPLTHEEHKIVLPTFVNYPSQPMSIQTIPSFKPVLATESHQQQRQHQQHPYVNCLMDLSLPSLAEPFDGVSNLLQPYPNNTGEANNSHYNKNEKLIDMALGELSWLSSSHISMQNDELGAFKLPDLMTDNEPHDPLFFKSSKSHKCSMSSDTLIEETSYERPNKMSKRSFNNVSPFSYGENDISITELLEVNSALKLLPNVGDESQTTFSSIDLPSSSTSKTSPNFRGLIGTENSMDFASTFLSLNVKKD